MKTRLCEKLGIDFPVMQAAIGGNSCPELAAAVSNAGGLGSVAVTGWGKEGTKAILSKANKLTSKGIIANVLLSYDVSEEIEAVLENPPKIVSFFWGDIAPYVGRVHEAGSLVMLTVGSVEEAKRAADHGADMIVAQGWEAGGHVRGEIATLPLIPAVVDAVSPLPVIAAGGITDGRGLAATLCLGAQAAWIGTRFLAASEADVHPVYRAKVFSAKTSDTYHSKLYDGTWPDAAGRVIKNKTISDWESAGRPNPGHRPGEGETIVRDSDGNEVKLYDAVAMRSDMTGDIEAAPLWAGQGVGLVKKEQSAAEILDELVNEARLALQQIK